MEKKLIILSVMFCMATLTFPQLSSAEAKQGANMMGNQQSSQMMSGQMMNQQMLRDMSGMMGQMNTLMSKMSGTMDRDKTMDQTRTRDMSRLMDDMSITMKEMSGQMGKGTLNSAAMKRIQDKMKTMNQTMEDLQKTSTL